MGTKNSLAEILGRHRRIIVTITGNDEIKNVLKQFGYTDERLASGAELLRKVETDFEIQKKEHAEAFVATQNYVEARENKKEIFRKDMKLLRIAAKASTELDRILPPTLDITNSREFYKVASAVYQNLANNPAHAAALATVGLKTSIFTERLASIKELDELMVIRDKETAEANVATEIRDQELDLLNSFCMDLRTVARVALSDNPVLKRIVDEL